MGLACRGVTHCDKCGASLSMNEIYICSNCEEKEKTDIEPKTKK